MAISFVAYGLKKDPEKIKREFVRDAFLRFQIIGWLFSSLCPIN